MKQTIFFVIFFKIATLLSSSAWADSNSDLNLAISYQMTAANLVQNAGYYWSAGNRNQAAQMAYQAMDFVNLSSGQFVKVEVMYGIGMAGNLSANSAIYGRAIVYTNGSGIKPGRNPIADY